MGASRGLGAALAQRFVANGDTVFGIARSKESLQKIQDALGSDHFFWTAADITSDSLLEGALREMERQRFVPDILVLNAAIQHYDLRETGYDHSFGEAVIDISLSASLHCIGAFLPMMLKRGHGTIMAVASTAALRPSVQSAAYSAAKAGLCMAMRSLRLFYHGRGVSIKTVMLGPIDTDMWEGKRTMLVPSAYQAAGSIVSFTDAKRLVLFYPFLTTFLLRISLFLPDRVFAAVSAWFMK